MRRDERQRPEERPEEREAVPSCIGSQRQGERYRQPEPAVVHRLRHEVRRVGRERSHQRQGRDDQRDRAGHDPPRDAVDQRGRRHEEREVQPSTADQERVAADAGRAVDDREQEVGDDRLRERQQTCRDAVAVFVAQHHRIQPGVARRDDEDDRDHADHRGRERSDTHRGDTMPPGDVGHRDGVTRSAREERSTRRESSAVRGERPGRTGRKAVIEAPVPAAASTPRPSPRPRRWPCACCRGRCASSHRAAPRDRAPCRGRPTCARSAARASR